MSVLGAAMQPEDTSDMQCQYLYGFSKRVEGAWQSDSIEGLAC